MLFKTFSVMIVVSFVSAVITGRIENVGVEFARSMSDAVSLCITLLGMMSFWSGFMSVLKANGSVKMLSFILKPILKIIYGKNTLNDNDFDNLSASVSANFLGLGNAALPLGIKAVRGFENGNSDGIASDSTIMFTVLNTVPFQLIPSTLIAMRTMYGSANPFDVIPYIWLCSVLINVFAVLVCKIFALLWRKTK